MSNLLPSHLFPKAWETFKRRPWLVLGMSFVYGISRNWVPSGPALVLGLLLLLLTGPIRGGYDMAMLRLARGDDSVSFDDLFAGFSKFRRLFLTWCLYLLAVVGGTFLLIVPGIIFGVALWPAFLLVMEDELSPVEALEKAWALTLGHKTELFILSLATFVGLIVGVLTFGVGLLVTFPLTQLAWVHAYHEMRLPSEGPDSSGSNAPRPYARAKSETPHTRSDITE